MVNNFGSTYVITQYKDRNTDRQKDRETKGERDTERLQTERQRR
jgi:hypothetical protein